MKTPPIAALARNPARRTVRGIHWEPSNEGGPVIVNIRTKPVNGDPRKAV
jgi:hypothetical protein